MRYDTLYNNPVERERVTYSHVWWDNAFNDEELVNIETLCSSFELNTAVTVGEKDSKKNKEIRDSKIKFVTKNVKSSWIFDRLNFIGHSLNNQFYGFDLNGYETFQYTKYDKGGKYDWHMDLITNDPNPSSATRKLTMVMLLNEPEKDFTGGEFQLNTGLEKNFVIPEYKRGRIIAFPSFIIHRVSPILSGVRKSIVVWIEGPKFI